MENEFSYNYCSSSTIEIYLGKSCVEKKKVVQSSNERNFVIKHHLSQRYMFFFCTSL